MPTRKKQSLNGCLLAAQLMINNSLGDPGILAALSQFGYDQDKLKGGKQLLDEVKTLSNKQAVEYGIQYAAADGLKEKWATANKTYIRTLKVARIALAGNPKAEAALLLRGRRKQSLAGWLDQATTFYINLLNDPDLSQQMVEYGYDSAKLEAEANLIRVVAGANTAQKQNKGSARQATDRRNAKLAELEAWLSNFRSIIRVALEDHPAWLKKLGM